MTDKLSERMRASFDKDTLVFPVDAWADEVAELEKKANFLLALEIAGVDNWSGYSFAFEVAEDNGLEIE